MKKVECVVCDIVDQESVNSVNKSWVNDANELADFYKVICDATRLSIITLLLIEELCVCDIAHILKMSHSAISHQLKILKKKRFVIDRKVGKYVYYSIYDFHIESLIELTRTHIKEINHE